MTIRKNGFQIRFDILINVLFTLKFYRSYEIDHHSCIHPFITTDTLQLFSEYNLR